jgi:hypothetical protein
MSTIKKAIETNEQGLLFRPLSLLTEEEKEQLLGNSIPKQILEAIKKQTELNIATNEENRRTWMSFNLFNNQDYAERNTTQNSTDSAARKAAQINSEVENNNTQNKKNDGTKKNSLTETIGINYSDIEYGLEEYLRGNSSGSHGGDPLGKTTPGQDERDYGADSLLAWLNKDAKSRDKNPNSPNEVSLAKRLNFINKQNSSDRDTADKYTDGQGIARLGPSSGTGLNDRDWFELMRMQGDQFIGLARAKADIELSPKIARSQARELLIGRIKDYTSAGLNDGNLIGVLIGKGMSAEQFKSNPEEQARYNRYNQAKNGSYDWGAMTAELNKDGVNMSSVEKFTGIDRRNANLFTENLYYESYKNVQKMSDDLHYFKDKAVGFNLIFACDSSRDHNGALHMNQGSLTGLAADDKNPTIVLSPRNDEDMMKMIFRLSFIPKDSSIKGSDWLNRGLNTEEKSLMTMLADKSLGSDEKIKRFNEYLDKNGLEKNIGVANYMLKGHGWDGGIALFDQGNYDNGDKGIMALMGLSISAHVDQARIHQQSCSTAVGGDSSNLAVGNNTINDFAPATTKVVSVGANDIHWNGQGEHYQNVSYIHGNLVNEGQITEKQYYARQGLNTQIRDEEIKALALWTKNEDGIIVRKDESESSTTSQNSES